MSGFVCGNCGELFPEEAEFDPVADLLARVEPGEPMPAGDCPKCGCLVHPFRGEAVPEAKRQAAIQEAKRWVREVNELDLSTPHEVRGEDGGCWVRAWLFVPDEDMGAAARQGGGR